MAIKHDALFKSLLHAHRVLREFFEHFLPAVAEYVDFSHIGFVEKERTTLSGRPRTGDLLIRTRFKERPSAFLIHLEHQARRETRILQRMLEYFVLDWKDFDLPVYPILVLSGAATIRKLDLPVRIEYPDRCVLQFDFPVLDLRQADARAHALMPNLAALALSARMSLTPGQEYDLARDFSLSLAGAAAEPEERDAAADFFFSYVRLAPQDAEKLADELDMIESPEMRERIMEYANPFEQAGILKGIRQGRAEGLKHGRAEEGRELVLRLLHRRMGTLSPTQKTAVGKLSLSRIEALAEALLDFRAPGDLDAWLRKHTRQKP